MGVSGQLQAPAVLITEKDPLVTREVIHLEICIVDKQITSSDHFVAAHWSLCPEFLEESRLKVPQVIVMTSLLVENDSWMLNRRIKTE
jgi:hypothetical protein